MKRVVTAPSNIGLNRQQYFKGSGMIGQSMIPQNINNARIPFTNVPSMGFRGRQWLIPVIKEVLHCVQATGAADQPEAHGPSPCWHIAFDLFKGVAKRNNFPCPVCIDSFKNMIIDIWKTLENSTDSTNPNRALAMDQFKRYKSALVQKSQNLPVTDGLGWFEPRPLGSVCKEPGPAQQLRQDDQTMQAQQLRPAFPLPKHRMPMPRVGNQGVYQPITTPNTAQRVNSDFTPGQEKTGSRLVGFFKNRQRKRLSQPTNLGSPTSTIFTPQMAVDKNLFPPIRDARGPPRTIMTTNLKQTIQPIQRARTIIDLVSDTPSECKTGMKALPKGRAKPVVKKKIPKPFPKPFVPAKTKVFTKIIPPRVVTRRVSEPDSAPSSCPIPAKPKSAMVYADKLSSNILPKQIPDAPSSAVHPVKIKAEKAETEDETKIETEDKRKVGKPVEIKVNEAGTTESVPRKLDSPDSWARYGDSSSDPTNGGYDSDGSEGSLVI